MGESNISGCPSLMLLSDSGVLVKYEFFNQMEKENLAQVCDRLNGSPRPALEIEKDEKPKPRISAPLGPTQSVRPTPTPKPLVQSTPLAKSAPLVQSTPVVQTTPLVQSTPVPTIRQSRENFHFKKFKEILYVF